MDLPRLKEYVAERVTPKPVEYERIDAVISEVLRRVRGALEAYGIEAEVTLEGSVAKDTWLSGEADVDVFIQVPPRDKSFLEVECLSAIRKGLEGYPMVERYAEHPYIEAYAGDVRINVVPCFRVERGGWLSAADRTPYHTSYMREKLTPMLRREVRVFKRLLKSSGIYGAEARVKGFSGLLCELLTLNYGSFIDLLKAASKWRRRELIDVEGYYRGRAADALKLFPEPLIVVDPIDPGRNAAAAVAEDTMWSLVSISRLLLERPDIRFFYPETFRLDLGALRDSLEKTRGDFIALDIGEVDAVVDVVWSQLYKAEKVLKRLLLEAGFKVIRSAAWSSPDNHCMIFFKLEEGELPPTYRHVGPPVEMGDDSGKFLGRHLRAWDTAAGPWLEDGRWIVEKLRRYRRADQFIADNLADGGGSIGIPGRIRERLKNGFKVLVNEEALALAGVPGALEEIQRFLSGRPIWLDASL